MSEEVPSYACCQHCAGRNVGGERCGRVTHYDACEQPYCLAGRLMVGVIPPGGDHA